MDFADLVTPIASSDWDKGELGTDEGALDSNLDFLRKLDAETNVPVVVTNNNDGLEAGSLTGLGLLLDGDNFHDFVRESTLGVFNKLVNDGRLFDRDGVGVDFLKGGDVSVLDETAELGLGDPVILAATETAGFATTTATATSVAASAATTEAATSATFSIFCSLCVVCHLVFKFYNDIHSKFV